MEKFSGTLEQLIDSQKKTIQQLERLTSKFNDLSSAIQNYDQSIVTEKKLDELLKKLNNIDQIERKVSELESKLKDVKELNIHLQQVIEVTRNLGDQISRQSTNIKSFEQSQIGGDLVQDLDSISDRLMDEGFDDGVRESVESKKKD